MMIGFVSIAGAPAVADPTPIFTPPSDVGMGIDGAYPSSENVRFYYYWSVAYLENQISSDDPRLTDDDYLDDFGPHDGYEVGSVEHLLTAWFDSKARAALKDELADLDAQHDKDLDAVEKQIAEKGIVDEAEKARLRAEAAEKFQKAVRAATSAAWHKYVKEYITVTDNRLRGKAFELLVARLLGIDLTDKQWQQDKAFPGSRRRGDLWSVTLKVLNEMKSGNSISEEQLRAYLKIADELKLANLYVFFGSVPTEGTQKMIRRIAAEIEEENKGRRQRSEPLRAELSARVVPYTGVPVDIRTAPAKKHPGDPLPPTPEPPPPGKPAPTSPTGPKTGPPGTLAAAGQTAAPSAADAAFSASPASPAEAAETARVAQELATSEGYANAEDAGMAVDQLGGVDFSTLELRYLSDTYDGSLGSGLRYAYQVDPKPGAKVSYGGRQSAQLAADSFFTWLALPPSSFTVNLNPDEPDRIIDEELGRTDAGRVLLEADLRMKKSVATLIHPDSARGNRFWKSLRGETKCVSMRQWIVPRPAVVRENDNELFIVDAPLEVKMETDYTRTVGAGGNAGCDKQSAADTAYNETVYRTQILPSLEKSVNQAPEYADLRRVYASRVAAEWYRQRSTTHPTAYADLIDSEDVDNWTAKVRWSPREVFNRYVKSYKNGEFKIKRTTRRGNYIYTDVYVYGGVDLSTIPTNGLSESAFIAQRPALSAAVTRSLFAATPEAGKNELWLGGRSTQYPVWAPQPEPTSPLRQPQFYVLTALPLVAWLAVAAHLWRRRRRAALTTGPRS